MKPMSAPLTAIASAAPVFIGIDVACAQQKRLPLCIAACIEGRLEPLRVPELVGKLPVGRGNREILEEHPFRAAAAAVAETLNEAAKSGGWKIVRVAIDAPAAPPSSGERSAERELRNRGLSSFQTPHETAWRNILQSCQTHNRDGGELSRMPHANKIWMLYGFELFRELRATNAYDVIEVYPYSIVRPFVGDCPPKATPEGYQRQLEAIASKTSWTPADLELALKQSVSGSKHDRLDAFMAAWVASLSAEGRLAYGNKNDPDDAIWVPHLKGL
jgi:predicted nuclease with RNAse H fold